MPYINENDRFKFVDGLIKLEHANNAGELNYIFTVISNVYLINKGLSYQSINDIIGALEGCKLEFYRRLVADYEDKKIKENGDVF